MERIEVESTNIEAVTYNENDSVLTIEFKSGATYEYYDVPEYIVDELLTAESKGRYANRNIYKSYRYSKISWLLIVQSKIIY